MARHTAGKLRKLWLDIHLWIGVGLALAIIPISLTGAALVWHDPLDRMLHPARFAVSESKAVLAPSAYLEAARTAFESRATPTTVRFPEKAGMPVTVQGRMDAPLMAGNRPRMMTAFLDPATAKVTDVEQTSSSLISVMHRLHGSLLIPNIGRKVVGWIGWGMTISCITGLILWWPRKGPVAKGLRWQRTPSTMDNLHHIIGFWICIPLAVLSLTGVYISFPQTARAVMGIEQAKGKQAPPRNRPAPPPPLDQTASGIDEAVTAALGAASAGEVASITLPTVGDKPSWRVQVAAEGAPPSTLQVADGSLQVKADRGGGGRATQDSFSRLMRTIHDGQETPFVWQFIVFLGGVAPALLAITGIIMWARRQFRLARLRRPELQPAE
jgi:uncharacterized iron-regulated membrane protein